MKTSSGPEITPVSSPMSELGILKVEAGKNLSAALSESLENICPLPGCYKTKVPDASCFSNILFQPATSGFGNTGCEIPVPVRINKVISKKTEMNDDLCSMLAGLKS